MKDLKLVKDIRRTSNRITSEADIIRFVEEPCIETCKDFFYKNILTIQSSGHVRFDPDNFENNNFWITFDYLSLDKSNKQIVLDLLDGKEENQIDLLDRKGTLSLAKNNCCINANFKNDDTVESVSKCLLEFSKKFNYQDMIVGRNCAFETIVNELYYYLIDEEINNNSIMPDMYKNLYSDSDSFNNDLEKYDVKNANLYSEDELTYSYKDAIKYYAHYGKEGLEFVDRVMKLGKLLGKKAFPYDEEEDVFWCDKFYLDKHIEYLRKKDSKKNG